MRVIAAAGTRPELDFCQQCLAVWCDADEHRQLEHGALRTAVVDPRVVRGRELARQVERRRALGDGSEVTDAPDNDWKRLLGYLGFPVIEGDREVSIRPWLTWGLAALLLVIHVLVLANLEMVISSWGFVPADWGRHGGLTILTSAFLHAGWWHLLGNLYFLVLVGDAAEAELGRWRMAGLLLAAVVFDTLVEMVLMENSRTTSIGASGWISALMGFFVVVHPRARVCINFRFFWWLRFPAWGAFAFWCLLQIWLSYAMMAGIGNVNGIAHLTGAVAGLAAGWWWRQRVTTPPPG